MQWDGFVAGAVAGASGTLVGHAFDTAKVIEQVGRSGPRQTLNIRTLYRGVVPPLLTTGFLRSLNFGVFEEMKMRLDGRRDPGMETIFVSAAVAGAAICPLTAPLVTVKITQQVHGGRLLECVRDELRRGGVRSLYRGFPLHFGCECVGNGAYLTTYAYAKQYVARDEGYVSSVACGAVAGWAGWLTIYPLDVLRSRVISLGAGGGPSLAPLAAARACYAEHGLRGFFVGIRLTLLRAAPVAGVVLPINDYFLRLLRTKEVPRL